jgi:hypothetical protein
MEMVVPRSFLMIGAALMIALEATGAVVLTLLVAAAREQPVRPVAVRAAVEVPPVAPPKDLSAPADEAVDPAPEVPPVKEPPPPLPAIDPNSPITDLLPPEPNVKPRAVYLGDDLGAVTEIYLEGMPRWQVSTELWKQRKARAVAGALHLNAKEEDGFLKALLRERPDLAGLPFLMGKACRSEGGRRLAFKTVAERIGPAQTETQTNSCPTRQPSLVEKAEKGQLGFSKEDFGHVRAAFTAQVMGAEEIDNRRRMVGGLAALPGDEATRRLLRIAVFDPEYGVRKAALEALMWRQYNTTLLAEALHYPWPAVVRNAAEAIRVLNRKDLVPLLKKVLHEPDPRAPRREKVNGRMVPVVRELVRINHHKSCLLCHAAAEHGKTPTDALLADMPLLSEPLPSPGSGYGGMGPAPRAGPSTNLLVRIDVTYLRQDFSLIQPVYDASAWRVMQRFDFVVRRRVLTESEAADVRERLAQFDRKGMSPYRKAAAAALKELTGGDG